MSHRVRPFIHPIWTFHTVVNQTLGQGFDIDDISGLPEDIKSRVDHILLGSLFQEERLAFIFLGHVLFI